MKFYTIYNTYNVYPDYRRLAIMNNTPSIVDFGTAMANKRRTKRNRRK